MDDQQRIMELPRVSYEGQDLNSTLRKVPATGETLTLRPLQNQALAAIKAARGGFFPIGVGHGKAFIACLAGTVLHSKAVVILTKAKLVHGLQQELTRVARQFRITSCRIISYSTLSSPRSTDMLEAMVERFGHDLCIVADEAHCLKGRGSARTRRVERILKAHPEVSFVALSGTLFTKSIKDCAHIAEWALKALSPLPRDKHLLESWANVLDVGGRPEQGDFARMAPFIEAFTKTPRSTFPKLSASELVGLARQAFQTRLRCSMGVVCSQEGSLGTSLVLELLEEPKMEPHVQAAWKQAEDNNQDPNGDEFPDDLSLWRFGRQITTGYFYWWDWPGGVVDEEWLAARKDWSRFVRNELSRDAGAGYDSPFLVENAVRRRINRGDTTSPICQTLLAWDAVRERPAPPTRARWLSTKLVEHAVDWVHAHADPTILWYETKTVGDALRLMGMEVLDATSTPDQYRFDQPRHVAMSWPSHRDGHNLQAWHRALVLEPPPNGQAMEQLLGRMHRSGQEADEVTVAIYHHADPYRRAVADARKQARFIEDSTGNVQKLNIATYTDSDAD